MKNVSKDGVLNRRNVCGSGLSAAALFLTGCGGGGGVGDSAGGNSAGPINGGLGGSMYYSFVDQTFKVDLASGNVTEIRFRNQDAPSETTYRVNTNYFDVSADSKTLFFMDDLFADGLAAIDIKSKAARTVLKVSRPDYWDEIRQSPDGTKFAMVRNGLSDFKGVYLVEASGTDITNYKKNEGAVNSVAWTPDNRLLYSNNGIYLTNPGDLKSSLRISTTSASSIAVNPAGDKIVYASQGHIWTMGINGDNALQVTAGDNAEFQPRWSPDGKHIVFQSQIYGTNSTGGVATTGNIYYLGVIPSDGRQYTLNKTGPSGTGGSTATGVLAGEGVILLKAQAPEISSRLLVNIPAYDMIWR
jgi:hypothetical protein